MSTFARRDLWSDLGRARRRGLEASGWDLFGEWLLARWHRRVSVARLRGRAEAIEARRAELAGLDEFSFGRRIAAAREAVLLRSDHDSMNEALAVVAEVVRRTLGLTLYVEQVMGALVMAGGGVAEMATGEGKTVTAVLPTAVLGWCGRGVHVHTVNDYLARRDAEITGDAYSRLGLSVAALQDPMGPRERAPCYAASVTYGAGQQFIFDYLRDRVESPLVRSLASHLLDTIGGTGVGSSRCVQRGLFAAVVDEADSVLIDEAITPAILAVRDADVGRSGPTEHEVAASIASALVPGRDYDSDARTRKVYLTDAGREALEGMAKDLPPFWAGPRRREEIVTTALTAMHLFHKGDDYIVREAKVQLVDRSTGRILEGREWQLGLHQAVEAKEGLTTSGDKTITARIGYQRFFQRYERLCGMSGTVWEVRDELWRNYRLAVRRVPTHRPVIRTQVPDRIFATTDDKVRAVVARVSELHLTGRPVLVGTRSVNASKRVSKGLEDAGVSCAVLNAERESEEAEIVARAGRAGAVTVATNMAGRGTDIKLDDRARELGGLVVIATERHAERRVDRQLFGRSGRQGDPGAAEVYSSLEDDLIERGASAFSRTLVGWAVSAGPVGRACARLGLRFVQDGLSRAAASARAAAAKHEAQQEMAMHRETR